VVVLHHIPQVDRMLAEFVRILRPDGYLIIREHNCKDDRSLAMKYLHFVHAFMVIAGVDELAGEPDHSHGNDPPNWNELKTRIIEYTSSIHYRTRDEWQEKLVRVGFELRAILEYGSPGSNNPQELYFGVYQLRKK
jgi:SAM-dependent methyltransferase